MKTFLLFLKTLSLSFSLFLILANPLSAQICFADPVIDTFGLSAPGGDTVSRVILSDIDHDGTIEAFIPMVKNDPPDYSWRDLRYYKNIGSNDNPMFVFQESYPFGMPEDPKKWLWQLVDVNGDGWEDFVSWGFIFSNPVSIVLNNGSNGTPDFDNTFLYNPFGITLPISDEDGDILDAVTPTFVDINADGDLDLFYGGVFGNGIVDEGLYYSENTGSSTNPQYALPEKNPFGFNFPPGMGYHRVSFADVDCDGDLDMYFMGLGSGSIPFHFYFENTGNATSPDFSSLGAQTEVIGTFGSFIDIGGDGDLDVITGTGGSGILYYENQGCCPPVSTKGLELEATLTLQPNPASDLLTIDLVSAVDLNQAEVEIFNTIGQKITGLSVLPSGKTIQEAVSLNGFPSGIYLLKVSSKGKFLTQKFLKL